MDFLKLLSTLSTIDGKTKIAEGESIQSNNPVGIPEEEELDEFDIDTLNQLASHPMAGTLAAAGGAAIGATIGKGITKANDWYQKRKEEKALDRAAGVKEEKVDESANKMKEDKCNECGMYESKCSCDHGKDEIEEMMRLAGQPIKEAKKKKPDADKDGIPDYAQDGKGKMEEAKLNEISDQLAQNALAGREDNRKAALQRAGSKAPGEASWAADLEAERTSKARDRMGRAINRRDARRTAAGISEEDDVEEGNEFSGELAKAKSSGQKEFEVDGKKYPVKEATSADLMKRWAGIFEAEEKCADCGEVHTGDCAEDTKEKVDEVKMADLPSRTVKGKSYGNQDDYEKPPADARRPAKTMPLKKDKKPLGEAMEECMDGGDGGMEDNFSINSSMDSSGHKSVSISATGSKADELTAILKNAGLGVMGGGDEEHVEMGHDDHGDMGGDVEVVSVPLAQHDGYQAPDHEEEMDEEADAGGFDRATTAPHAQTQSVGSQMHQGNDLNREKDMHKHSYRQGDNPMAMEQVQALERLERELMEELSALKVVSEKYMGFGKTVGALKKQGGVKNPEALAASIGRKKYGKKKFQNAAAKGKKLG